MKKPGKARSVRDKADRSRNRIARRHMKPVSVLLLVLLAADITPVEAHITKEDNVRNTFSFISLSCEIREPSWDPEAASGFVPCLTIPKDPVLTNTSSEGCCAVGALEVSFLYPETCPREELRGAFVSEEDMEMLADILDIDYVSEKEDTAWVRFEGESAGDKRQRFYFTRTLTASGQASDTTDPLFTRVMIKKEADQDDFARLEETGGFTIALSGCVLALTEGEDPAESARQAAADGRFVFH